MTLYVITLERFPCKLSPTSLLILIKKHKMEKLRILTEEIEEVYINSDKMVSNIAKTMVR